MSSTLAKLSTPTMELVTPHEAGLVNLNDTVVDVEGEEPHMGIIASISNDNPACVSVVGDERLAFQDGDLVVSSEVIGMTILHGGNPRKLKNASPYSFTLNEDTIEYGTIERGGIVTSVQQPKVLAFNPFPETLKDLGDGRFGEIGYNVIRHFTFGTGIVLNSMIAMVGNIVGQDVNACIGKLHPIFQFSYFHSAESLSSQHLDPNDFWPFNKHYDAPTSIFGSKLQKTIANAGVFVVGFGARGCDFLKYLALMGVSCGDKGKLTIPADAIIEESNSSWYCNPVGISEHQIIARQ